VAGLAACYEGEKSGMKPSLMLSAVLALGLALFPQAAPAQTDQTTAGPMSTATANPEATDQTNPGATDQGMGTATATPATDQRMSTTTTNTTGGSTGWWGLVGLIGLLGLFGGRSGRRTTGSGPP
jgi:MYXO-CTERM domain-containing protein